MSESKTPNMMNLTFENRIVEVVRGTHQGPTLVFFGGIHGNEPAGLYAIEEVLGSLGKRKNTFSGTVFGIKGNQKALQKELRFVEEDLNRMWTQTRIKEICSKPNLLCSSEEKELKEIYELITEIINSEQPPFYFIDLHTTSSKTIPFVTINDALINRHFSKLFSVPVVLGIEEYLSGPLLSFINERGYVSLGFEAGQHRDETAVKNGIAFLWMALHYAGFLELETHEKMQHKNQLKWASKENDNFYDVRYKHLLVPGDDFKMKPGFSSFQRIAKGTSLAKHNGEEVVAKRSTILFMPLYQGQGLEGFFQIRKLSPWILRTSALLRKIKLDTLLTVLPGVRRNGSEKEQLIVNLQTARFFAKPFFHLLGYRHRLLDEDRLRLNSRDRVAKTEMYRKTSWFRQ